MEGVAHCYHDWHGDLSAIFTVLKSATIGYRAYSQFDGTTKKRERQLSLLPTIRPISSWFAVGIVLGGEGACGFLAVGFILWGGLHGRLCIGACACLIGHGVIRSR